MPALPCGTVYARCTRSGSLDSAIRNVAFNDFVCLRTLAPSLRRVAFNGQTAARHARLFVDAGYETCILPSSSPAYTLAFDRKLTGWRTALALPEIP